MKRVSYLNIFQYISHFFIMWAYHLGLLKLVAKVYKLFVFPYTFT